MTEERDGPPADRFWQFSLELYDRPGVADACLVLQDRYDLDVNMMLWCCWHAAEGRALRPAEVATAEARVAAWQVTVVGQLRAMRRRLKGGIAGWPADPVESFRTTLKDAELGAERLEQTVLAAVDVGRPSPAPPAETAALNVDGYLQIRGVALEGYGVACRRTIIEACGLTAPTRPR